ncbi:MAG TPA: adenosylcobinamide-phosphate synthase CbiB [Acidobacteriaceae bacterium]
MLAAYALDCVVGDPESLPHPVRLFGKTIRSVETRALAGERSPEQKLLAGAALAVGLPAATGWITHQALRQLRSRSPLVATMVEVGLGASCVATQNLLSEALPVVQALERNDLATARTHVARIVGRDTAQLDAHEISRAVIETLAESLCDGILAPLFYLAVGGVPAALAYKAINTMDSVIGHTSDRYWHFGKAAARLDDAANLIPAHAGALLLCAASAITPGESRTRDAWQTWRADRNNHASPNAGQMESAMAGALGVRLGGTNFYDGEPHHTPEMGAQFPAPDPADARRALTLTAVASVLGLCAAVALIACSANGASYTSLGRSPRYRPNQRTEG